MAKDYFGANKIINEQISDVDLRAFYVGFDFGVYRGEKLMDIIMSSLVDFSFGFHEGILKKYTIKEIKKAASMVYNIKPYDSSNPECNVRYPKSHKSFPGELKYKDADEWYKKKYSNRGEFGELILHLLLRDFLGTRPLISKIYLKDSPGVPAHGFDSVHIGESPSDPLSKSLYLGESKLKINGTDGIDELLDDIEKHFVKNFLTVGPGEFALISNKQHNFIDIEDCDDKNTKDEYDEFIREKNEWFEKIDGLEDGESLEKLFDSITIPLICTYTSSIFSTHLDTTTAEFIEEYEAEIKKLKERLDQGINKIKLKYKGSGEPISTNLNILLMLFPVKCKEDLVRGLHEKLYHQQNI